MKKYVLVSLCFLLLANFCQAETLDRWPVDFTQPENLLSSPFGPRLKASDNYRYDFHRGIDIPGSETDAVKATKYGKVFRIFYAGDPDSPYPNGGTVVILRHAFSAPYTFHDATHAYYYTLYMHLSSVSSNLKLNQYVDAGTLLGYIGHSGDTDFNHLHFEIRVGTVCSLASSCNKGYDPHINPYNFLPYNDTNNATLDVRIENDDVLLDITTLRKELDLNKFSVQVVSKTCAIQEKTLNFDTREGLDATSAASLDTPDYAGIIISPTEFSNHSANFNLQLTFQELIKADSTQLRVSIWDVHGNKVAAHTVNLLTPEKRVQPQSLNTLELFTDIAYRLNN